MLFLDHCNFLNPWLFWQAWESSTSFAAAYSLGRCEAEAALNLMSHVPNSIVWRLTEIVRTRLEWNCLGLMG